MAEYIEREAALKVLRGKAIAKYPSTIYMGLFAAANEVREIPAADVVEVVRCKDCKFRYETASVVLNCSMNGIPVDDDDFCSYGERRNDGA